MKLDRGVSLTFDLTPREAMELVEKIIQLPDLPKETMDNIGSLRDMSVLIESGGHDEFTMIVRVRREPK